MWPISLIYLFHLKFYEGTKICMQCHRNETKFYINSSNGIGYKFIMICLIHHSFIFRLKNENWKFQDEMGTVLMQVQV